MLKELLTTAAVMLAVSVPASAADPVAADTSAADQATTATAARSVPDAVIAAQAEGQVRTTEIVGLTVVSADGQEVGEVSDLILDDQEKLSGVVVGIGGFLGIGEKLVAIDWRQAEVHADVQTAQARLLVGLTAAELEAAPPFAAK